MSYGGDTVTTFYETQIQPMGEGWGLVIRISASDHNHYWTSPLAPLKGSTIEEAEASARAEVAALKRALEPPGPPICGATTVFWPDCECCDAECHLRPDHKGLHEDPILGPWSEEEMPTRHPVRP